jgi:hypothetical protein
VGLGGIGAGLRQVTLWIICSSPVKSLGAVEIKEALDINWEALNRKKSE